MENQVVRQPIRVLVVDDSVLMGTQIAKILSSDEEIEVIGRVKNGLEALDMVAKLKPDVVTLDVEMPIMDGITALKHLMVRTPVPVVMLSSLTTEGSKVSFDALRYGALDVIAKPSRRETESLEAQKEDIITRVKQAATIGVYRSRYRRSLGIRSGSMAHSFRRSDGNTRVIGIGSGTGSYHSLLQVIPNLRKNFNDVLVVLMATSSQFIGPFTDYLAKHSTVPVKNLHNDGSLVRGSCYVGSSEDKMVLEREKNGTLVFRRRIGDELEEGSIDRLFRSLARTCGSRAVGIVMSGAGNDGAEGIAAIRESGGLGVIQATATCMNPSMPRAVLARGPVDRIIPDFLLADFLMNLQAEAKAATPHSPPIPTELKKT